MSRRINLTRFRDLRTLFYSALFIWSLYLLYELTTWDQFEDWSVPLIVMIPLLILLSLRILELLKVQVIQDILPEEEEQSLQDLTADTDDDAEPGGGDDPADESASEDQGNSEYVVVGSVIALTIAVYLFGFMISLPLFVFLFILYLDDWKGALVTTVIFSIVVYILFIVILNAFIWPGIFFDIQVYLPF